jgi:hypothetical protein
MRNPSPTPDDCIETVRDSKPKVEENGRKAIFLNPERVSIKKVRVDGCLIKEDGLKADYIVSKPEVIDVIVEETRYWQPYPFGVLILLSLPRSQA